MKYMYIPISYRSASYIDKEVLNVLPREVPVPRECDSSAIDNMLTALEAYVTTVGRALGIKLEAVIGEED
jgi:hypothetical protein